MISVSIDMPYCYLRARNGAQGFAVACAKYNGDDRKSNVRADGAKFFVDGSRHRSLQWLQLSFRMVPDIIRCRWIEATNPPAPTKQHSKQQIMKTKT